MNKKLVLLALLSVTALAGAQPGTAIKAAKNAASAANARNQKVADEQAAATSTQRQATPAQQGAAGTAQGQVAGQPPAGTAVAQRSVPTITREIFQYDGGGRRDPFLSLTRTGALRPHISELSLTIVMVGSGSTGVATIIDNTTKERYLVKVGDLLGRYRVVQIDAKSVTFAIEEFGYSRQERLAIGDTSKVRNQ
jgi:hypothetical protein